MASPLAVKRTTYQQSFNGEEYSFTEPVPEDLICAVCHELLNETQQTPCGHLFCSQCLERVKSNCVEGHLPQLSFARQNCIIVCPNCRTLINGGTFNDKNTDRRVKNLQITCTNGSCEWKGSLCDLDNHRTGRGRKGCEYEPIPCVLGCGVKIVLGNIYSQNVEDHLQECPEQKVACPYSDLGCRVLSKRRLLDSHVEASKDHHLKLTMKRVSQLTRIIERSLDTSNELSLTTPPWLCNSKLFPSMPWIIRLDDFAKKKVAGVDWTSDPFFTTARGYKLRLRFLPGGHSQESENHISVFIVLQHGPNNDILSWPFDKTVKVTLLNQLEDGLHRVDAISFDNAAKECSEINPGAQTARGWGNRAFLPHSKLDKSKSGNCQYLKNDCLFFKIKL